MKTRPTTPLPFVGMAFTVALLWLGGVRTAWSATRDVDPRVDQIAKHLFPEAPKTKLHALMRSHFRTSLADRMAALSEPQREELFAVIKDSRKQDRVDAKQPLAEVTRVGLFSQGILEYDAKTAEHPLGAVVLTHEIDHIIRGLPEGRLGRLRQVVRSNTTPNLILDLERSAIATQRDFIETVMKDERFVEAAREYFADFGKGNRNRDADVNTRMDNFLLMQFEKVGELSPEEYVIATSEIYLENNAAHNRWLLTKGVVALVGAATAIDLISKTVRGVCARVAQKLTSKLPDGGRDSKASAPDADGENTSPGSEENRTDLGAR